MTLSNPKKYYSRFLKGHEGKLHFSAHSHHFWPDISREAHLQYWDDCASLSDDKWNKIFGEVIPTTQKHIAEMLHLKDPSQIALAPNTHELTSRLLSLFVGKTNLSILTTSNEFHSWGRQLSRIMELTGVNVKKISADQISSDRKTFIKEVKAGLKGRPDVFFMSQVFFDSGLALTDDEIIEITEAAPAETLVVIDGYHAFAAIPVDLSRMEGRIFYLGGGYKYAQGGEGIGFMVVPKGEWRPVYTGWFAEYDHLSGDKKSLVGYAPDAMSFWGATQDSSGFYRFNAVWNQFNADNVSIREIHEYVRGLQLEFIRLLPKNFIEKWKLLPLFNKQLLWHGHFLTFESASLSDAEELFEILKKEGVFIDKRGRRLRFGFGLYQDLADVENLSQCLKKLADFAQ